MGIFNPLSNQLTISGQVNGTVGNGTISICQRIPYALRIDSVDLSTNTGTCTVAVQMGGVNVTSLDAIAVTSTPGNTSATGANNASVGTTNAISLVITGASNATNLAFTLNCTRT